MTFSQRGSASFPKSLARRRRRMGGLVADARPSPLIRTPIITYVPYPSRYPSFDLFLSSWLENFCHESQVSNSTLTPFLELLFLSNRNNTITNNKKKIIKNLLVIALFVLCFSHALHKSLVTPLVSIHLIIHFASLYYLFSLSSSSS